jgi:hypothetical protein
MINVTQVRDELSASCGDAPARKNRAVHKWQPRSVQLFYEAVKMVRAHGMCTWSQTAPARQELCGDRAVHERQGSRVCEELRTDTSSLLQHGQAAKATGAVAQQGV